jgi:hypothetical protein
MDDFRHPLDFRNLQRIALAVVFPFYVSIRLALNIAFRDDPEHMTDFAGLLSLPISVYCALLGVVVLLVARSLDDATRAFLTVMASFLLLPLAIVALTCVIVAMASMMLFALPSTREVALSAFSRLSAPWEQRLFAIASKRNI